MLPSGGVSLTEDIFNATLDAQGVELSCTQQQVCARVCACVGRGVCSIGFGV